MNKHKNDTWLSVYLFYNEPWEDFLQKAVEPYVNTAIQTGIAHQYFFIRYWENGPHIRLRMKGEVEMVNTILKPNLEEHFNHYFESKPSRRIEPQYPPDFSEDLKWNPNNTLTYVPYERESDRFGGNVGILLCEKQFMLSSKTVLDFIKQKGTSWSYDDAMGIAIKLHLSFVHASGMTMEEAIQFFHYFTKNWIPYTFRKSEKEWTVDEYQNQTNSSIEFFESSFENQKSTLIPFIKVLWEALENKDSFDEAILNNWVEANNSIIAELVFEEKENRLNERPLNLKYRHQPDNPFANELLWSIYVDLIHLTNNRLGILNRDEPYLSFMMMRCLEEIKKNEMSEVV